MRCELEEIEDSFEFVDNKIVEGIKTNGRRIGARLSVARPTRTGDRYWWGDWANRAGGRCNLASSPDVREQWVGQLSIEWKKRVQIRLPTQQQRGLTSLLTRNAL